MLGSVCTGGQRPVLFQSILGQSPTRAGCSTPLLQHGLGFEQHTGATINPLWGDFSLPPLLAPSLQCREDRSTEATPHESGLGRPLASQNDQLVLWCCPGSVLSSIQCVLAQPAPDLLATEPCLQVQSRSWTPCRGKQEPRRVTAEHVG